MPLTNFTACRANDDVAGNLHVASCLTQCILKAVVTTVKPVNPTLTKVQFEELRYKKDPKQKASAKITKAFCNIEKLFVGRIEIEILDNSSLDKELIHMAHAMDFTRCNDKVVKSQRQFNCSLKE